MKPITISRRDAGLVLAAICRADNWTEDSIASLKGATDPSDLKEIAEERKARIAFDRLSKRIIQKLSR